MGTWGTGLFDDDTAFDVREAYLELLAAGTPVGDATAIILRRRAEALADMDEGPVIWLALAATQWEYGAFGPGVQEQALAILERGDDLAHWEEGGRVAHQRRRVLARLAAKLRRPLPPVRRPRPRKPVPPPPSHTVLSPDGLGSATVYELSGDPNAPERSQVLFDLTVNGARGGGHIAVLRCPWDAVGLAWRGPDTIVITHPPGAVVVRPEPAVDNPKIHVFASGRWLAVEYVERAAEDA